MSDLQQRGLRSEAAARPLADVASDLAAELLGDLGDRWRHTQGVARRAAEAAATVPEGDRSTLVAAAWLHDIGYAEQLRRCGFHPLDGACYLENLGWPETVAGLVAHHSGARFVAQQRGLAGPLARFVVARYAWGPLADALTWADQTTGPDGQQVDFEDRLADMLRRHGPDSPNARVHARRAPALRAAVRRVEQRLRAQRRGAGMSGERRG